MTHSPDSTGPDGMPRLNGLTATQKIKLQAAIEAAWLAQSDERRAALRVQGILAGDACTRFRREGQAIWFSFAGEDFGVVDHEWIFNDEVKEMPEGQWMPLDAPNTIPPEWETGE
ncbi:hypothetical protein AB5J55_31570 [Streptomyces sp. R11]|uniref:DUF551 domain-containing protein n=1 Tax=Streptomyces sp. R11 TaxID=3238625 RepID=A0AB39N7I3_9ACTN